VRHVRHTQWDRGTLIGAVPRAAKASFPCNRSFARYRFLIVFPGLPETGPVARKWFRRVERGSDALAQALGACRPYLKANDLERARELGALLIERPTALARLDATQIEVIYRLGGIERVRALLDYASSGFA